MTAPGGNSVVAVLGNGLVGTALARGFAELHYRVIFGTRDVNSIKTRAALAHAFSLLGRKD